MTLTPSQSRLAPLFDRLVDPQGLHRITDDGVERGGGGFDDPAIAGEGPDPGRPTGGEGQRQKLAKSEPELEQAHPWAG